MREILSRLRAWLRALHEPRTILVPGEPWSPLGRRLMAIHMAEATRGRRWQWR